MSQRSTGTPEGLCETLPMSSMALAEWRATGLARLAELESVHADLTGSGRGRRWGTTQLNRSLFVALSAQFQSFCRDLHDEAVSAHVMAAIPAQRPMLQVLLTQGRKLDTGNPRRSALGSDFGRLGIDFVSELKRTGARTEERLVMLEELIDFRNAIGHGQESAIAALEDRGAIASTKSSYVRYRKALNGLAGTMNDVLSEQLASMLETGRPW